MFGPNSDPVVVNEYGTEEALDFLHGNATDGNGRYFSDYLNFDADTWEECHDHVQWAFPSHIPSRFNINAPVVDMEELAEGITVAGISNAMKLVEAYLASLGFAEGADKKWRWCFDKNNTRTFVWLTPYNHNYQRISRLLNFLHWIDPDLATHLLGEFLQAATDVIHAGNKMNGQYVIAPETVVYWSKAAIGRL